jgi:hypothetical protein
MKITSLKTLIQSTGALAMVLVSAGTLHAQILWETPQTYTGTTADISTAGTFVDAVTKNYSGLSETVGDTVFTFNNSTNISGGGYGGADGSDFFPAPAPTAYQEAVNGCAYTYTGNPAVTINLSGLHDGYTYQIEVWNVDNDPTRKTLLSSGANTVDFNHEFVLGLFTAGVTGTESFSFEGIVPGGAGEVNAVALREVSVPEPSTYAMMLAGLAFLGICLRRKSAQVK